MKTLFSCSALLMFTFSSLADPTRPPGGYQSINSGGIAASPASSLKLQIIQDSSSGKTATINGRLLQLGDQYQGFTLTDISAASVVLSRGEEQRILQLHNKTIKNYDK